MKKISSLFCKKDIILSFLLASISYLCLVFVIIKSYYDINCLYIAIEYGIYSKIFLFIVKKFKYLIPKILYNELIKNFLIILNI